MNVPELERTLRAYLKRTGLRASPMSLTVEQIIALQDDGLITIDTRGRLFFEGQEIVALPMRTTAPDERLT